MVMRTIEIKEISVEIKNESQVKAVARKIKEMYDDLNVEIQENIVKVSGDLHNLKKREYVKYLLSGGEIGTDIQAS